MDSEHIRALQAFNSGDAGPSNHQPAVDPALQGSQPNQSNDSTMTDILTNATPITRPDGWWKPKHDIPCTWPGCDQMFTCNHNVQQHIREAHTGERPHICGVCAARGIDSRYARPGTLYRHLRTQHNLEPDVKKSPRKTLQSTGPVSAVAVPALAAQPKKRGRKPKKSAGKQPATAPEPAPMQPPAFVSQSCEWCGAELTGAEHAILHMHLEHAVAASPDCGCSYCKSQLMQRAPLEPPDLVPPMPQQPTAFGPQVQQLQPRHTISASQLEQRLLEVQQEQLYTVSTTETSGDGDEFPAPIDPSPTPGPDDFEQQMWDTQPEQDQFGFIDYAQFGGDLGQLLDNIDDLFPELGDITKRGEYTAL